MTQAVGPITMVSFFNGFIDFICFKSLHPTVNNSIEQNKYYSTCVTRWWISNLAGVVWLGSMRMHKNREGFLKREMFIFGLPRISLKTDVKHCGPDPSWNCSDSGPSSCKIPVR